MKKFFAVIAVLVAGLVAANNVQAQKAIFKGMPTGAPVKVASDGSATYATTGTATSTAAAATINADSGIVTTEALTTAAAAVYTFTLTNSQITTASKCDVTVGLGTSSAGLPVLSTVTPASGSAVIKIANLHASAALNGTLKIFFKVRNP